MRRPALAAAFCILPLANATTPQFVPFARDTVSASPAVLSTPVSAASADKGFGSNSLRDASQFLAGGIQVGPLHLDSGAPHTAFRGGWTALSSGRFVVDDGDRSAAVASASDVMASDDTASMRMADEAVETTGSASIDTQPLEISAQRDTSMIHLAPTGSDDAARAGSAQVASAGDGFIPVSLRSTLSTERFSSPDASNLSGAGKDNDELQSPSDIDAATDAAWRAATDGEASMALQLDDVQLPQAKPTLTRREVCRAISEVAATQHLPTPFLVSLIWQESKFNERAVSPVGAQGIAQFMPQIAQEFGLDNPFEPLKALTASARMLRGLVDQFGNLGLAAAAYNGGSGRVENWLARKTKLPAETRTYVMRVTGRTPEHWKAKAQHHVLAKIEGSAPCPGVESFAETLNEKARVALEEAKERAKEKAAEEKVAKEKAKSKSPHQSHAHHLIVAKAEADEKRKSGEKSHDVAQEKSHEKSRVTSRGGRKTLILAVKSSASRSSNAAEKSRKHGRDTHVAAAN